VTHGICIPGSVTDKFLSSLVIFIVVWYTQRLGLFGDCLCQKLSILYRDC